MSLLIISGVLIGVLTFLSLVYLMLKRKFKDYISQFGYVDFKSLIEDIKKGDIESKMTPKHVTGMTKLLIPKIINDFPNFSETELYNKVETSLLLVFESLEKKELKSNDELVLLRDKLKEQISDYRSAKIDVKYDDVKFHRHALKYYKKDEGALNITISSALEYYYKKSVNGKIIDDYSEYKKQTRYTTEFIYIYNPDKIVRTKSLIGINCPNCGAPVKKLGLKKCSYCGSGLEDINLKSWHISLYKEDYK